MVTFTPFDDPFENLLIVGIAMIAAVAFFANFTTLDAQVRFAATDTAAFLGEPANDSIVFRQSDIDFINRFPDSLGTDATADERLWCMTTRNRRVTTFRFVSDIEFSDIRSVSGRCFSQFGQAISGTVHTQPGSPKLSEEDKNLESRLKFSCIAYKEVAVSPVSGRVDGLRCWEIDGFTDPTFTEIPVIVR